MRVRGAVHQRLARAHAIALVHARCACPSGSGTRVGSPPSSGVTITRRLPRDVGRRRTTMPSISETIANSLGLRASKSSATRGRPPVMSLVSRRLARDLRDARRRRRPASPSVDRQVRAHRQQLVARASRRSRPSTEMRGRSVGILRLDDHLRRQTGELVHLLPHGLAFDDVAELRPCPRPRRGSGSRTDPTRAGRRPASPAGRPSTRTCAP